MTLKLQKDEGAGWEDVDLVAEGVCGFRMSIGYSHPTTLTFAIKQAQHTTPIAAYAGIRFWDDAETDRDGNPFSSANPAFLGFVEDIDPGGESNNIEYTCLDSTARASSETPVMSTAWTNATTPSSDAVPRLVLNASIDNDDDWTFSRDFGLTVGQMIALILDDCNARLQLAGAAPSGDTAYVAADLAGLDFIPQEKIVFTNEPIRAAVMRLIDDWEPEWRMLFYPGTRKWRFGNIGSSTELTYTLNDFTVDHPVLKLQMDRSLENRYTAVKFYGPEALQNTTVTLSGGGLTDVSDGPELDTYGAGANVTGKNKWRITNSNKRRMGRLLPDAIFAPMEETRIGPNAWTQNSTWTRTPNLQVKYKNNTAGTANWVTMAGWVYNHETGIIDFKNRYVYRYNPYPEIQSGILQPNYENPEDVKLIYPSYIDPLTVRVPSSGWEGTAYDDHGLENELKIYDESLAVGFLFNEPVTSATRIAKFQVLAQKILNMKKNVLYHGGMTLEGIDYSLHLLDRRVNLAGVDGDGNPLTTGWESIGAIVTDVEYDWEEMTTTVSFNSDHSELLGFDPERVKQQLRVGAAYISQIVYAWTDIKAEWRTTEWGTPYLAQSLSMGASITPVIVDPFFGTTDRVETS